jgi:hypothetical protein
MSAPRKIIFKNGQSPGDIVMLLYGVASLHASHPGAFVTDVACPARELFHGSPLITPLDATDPEVTVIPVEYPASTWRACSMCVFSRPGFTA